jgi:hypothetical protein
MPRGDAGGRRVQRHGQGLLNYFAQLRSGDLDEIAQTGFRFGLRSFAKLLEARRQRLNAG